MATVNGPPKKMMTLLNKLCKLVERGSYLYAQKTLTTLGHELAVAVSTDDAEWKDDERLRTVCDLTPGAAEADVRLLNDVSDFVPAAFESGQPLRTDNIIAPPEPCSLKDEPFGLWACSACGDWRMCVDSNDKASLPKELRRAVEWQVLGTRAQVNSPTLKALDAMLVLRHRCLPPTNRLRSALDVEAKVISFLLRRANVTFDDARCLIEESGVPAAPFVANLDERRAAQLLVWSLQQHVRKDAMNAATLARFGLASQVYRCIYEGVVGMVKHAKDPLSIETGFMLQLLFGEVLQRLMSRHMISCIAAKSVSPVLLSKYLRNGFAHEQHVMFGKQTFKQVPDSLRKNLPAAACQGKYYIVWNVPPNAVEPNWAMFGPAAGVGKMLDEFQNGFLEFSRGVHGGLPLLEAVEKAYGGLFSAGVPAGPAESP